MRIVARLRRGLGTRRARAPSPVAAVPLRGLGEPPAASPPAAASPLPATSRPGDGSPPFPASPPADAGEAELDTLRGELVRELDRLAEDEDGSGSFRRIAS